MRKNKIISTSLYALTVCFYYPALINYTRGNHSSIDIVWLCLGSAFFCLGILHSEKSKENKENKDEE